MKKINMTQEEYDKLYELLDEADERIEEMNEDEQETYRYVPSPEEVRECLRGDAEEHLNYLLYVDGYVPETPANKENKRYLSRMLRECLVITD